MPHSIRQEFDSFLITETAIYIFQGSGSRAEVDTQKELRSLNQQNTAITSLLTVCNKYTLGHIDFGEQECLY